MTSTLTPTEQRPNEQLPSEQSQLPTAQPQLTPYPYPPGPVQWAPPPPKPGHGLAITSLVLGIVGVVFGFIPLTFFVALPLGVLGLIFGIVGRRHGMGKAGAILGAIAVAFGIWGAVIVNNAVDDITNDLNNVGAAPVAVVHMVNP